MTLSLLVHSGRLNWTPTYRFPMQLVQVDGYARMVGAGVMRPIPDRRRVEPSFDLEREAERADLDEMLSQCAELRHRVGTLRTALFAFEDRRQLRHRRHC